MSEIFRGLYPFVVAFVDGPRMGSEGHRVPFHSVDCSLRECGLTHITRSEPLDEKTFDTLRQTLLAYIQSEYTYGTAESSAPCASNISSPLSLLTH